MKTQNIEITTLEDGRRIVTQKADFNNVFIGAWIKVGLVNESDEENGLSHFLEHMVFKGTETKTALELSDYIENPYLKQEINNNYKLLKLDISELDVNSKIGKIDLKTGLEITLVKAM